MTTCFLLLSHEDHKVVATDISQTHAAHQNTEPSSSPVEPVVCVAWVRVRVVATEVKAGFCVLKHQQEIQHPSSRVKDLPISANYVKTNNEPNSIISHSLF